MLAAQERAIEIDRTDEVQLFQAGVLDRRTDHYTGVVDQHMQSAVPLDDIGDDAFPGSLTGNVEVYKSGLTADFIAGEVDDISQRLAAAR